MKSIKIKMIKYEKEKYEIGKKRKRYTRNWV